MKEKQPTVLEVTDVRNMDVPELKMIVCCDNPATGECLNVCYLEDGRRHVLSLATDPSPAPCVRAAARSGSTWTRARGAGRRRRAAKSRHVSMT